jgi:hypothetical protein
MAKKLSTADNIRYLYFIKTNKDISDTDVEHLVEKIEEIKKHDNISYSYLIGSILLVVKNQNWGEKYNLEITKIEGNVSEYKSKHAKYSMDGIYGDTIESLTEIKGNKEFIKLFPSCRNTKEIEKGFPYLATNYVCGYLTEPDKYDYRTSVDRKIREIVEWSTLGQELKKVFPKRDMKKFSELKFDRSKDSDNMHYILDVFEGYNGMRFIRTWQLVNNNYAYFIVSTAADVYNFIDEKRPVYMDIGSGFYCVFDLKELDDFYTVIYDYVYYVRNRQVTPNTVHPVSDNDIHKTKSKMLLEEKKEERLRKLAQLKNEKYESDLNNMSLVPFVKNGISFRMTSMEYEGIKFETGSLFNYYLYLKNKPIDELVDFNTLMSTVIDTIVHSWIFSGRYDIPGTITSDINWDCIDKTTYSNTTFGKDEISFTIDGRKFVLSYYKPYYNINNIRINKMELNECLKHSICYSTEEAYNKFLNAVSSCSIKIQNAITNNLKKGIYIGYTYGSNVYSYMIEMKLKRIGKTTHIVVGKNTFRLADTNRLIDFNGRYEDFVKLLMQITSMSFKDMKELFKESKSRYAEALKKADELWQKTVKRFNIKTETIKEVTGYTVTGKSGNKYIIKSDGNANHSGGYKVWQVTKNGDLDYRCIVDKTISNQVGKDALVSRIYALANDVYVAKDVHTLKV